MITINPSKTSNYIKSHFSIPISLSPIQNRLFTCVCRALFLTFLIRSNHTRRMNWFSLDLKAFKAIKLELLAQIPILKIK